MCGFSLNPPPPFPKSLSTSPVHGRRLRADVDVNLAAPEVCCFSWQVTSISNSYLDLLLIRPGPIAQRREPYTYNSNKEFIFVLRKKGSKTKKRMKEEEIEKGDCGPPTRKVFFLLLRICRTSSPTNKECFFAASIGQLARQLFVTSKHCAQP